MFSLIDGVEAMNKLSSMDDYLDQMDIFDFESRLMKTILDVKTGLSLYRELIRLQVIKWSSKLITEFNRSLGRLTYIDQLKSLIPSKVNVIVTKAKLERGAAYCRHLDVIVIPYYIVGDSNTLAHELFHIISRNNITIREQLYQSIGFNPLGFRLKISRNKIKVTNPDALYNEHYIDIKSSSVVPYIYSFKQYNIEDTDFFKYIKLGLINMSNTHNQLDINVSTADYFNEFNDIDSMMNRSHPEEIMATYFSRILTKTMDEKDEKIKKIKKILKL